MKKEIQFTSSIKLLCVLAAGLLLLPACGKTEEKDADGAAAPMESDEIGADFEYQFVAKSENGYYFWERISPDHLHPRLMFMDKESGRVVPLCNRPDCVHEGKECNAYFREHHDVGGGIHKKYLQYYEGNLYAVGLSEDAYVSLFRIKADGSAEWEISAKLYRTDYAATHRWESPEVLIEGGYAYFVDWYQKIKKLERMPIDGGMPETVFEGDSDASAVNIYQIKSNGGTLFFQVISYPDDIPENVVGALYSCDSATGQCNLVKAFVGPYSVYDGFVYHSSSEGLCRYSIQDQTTEILVNQPMNVPNITITREYIILCDQWEDGAALTLYDYEGKEIATVPNTLGLAWYFGGDSDMLFGECWNDYTALCFLNLNRPVTELQWEKLRDN
ncbi:MAG: DUF5050 domain-containing protein [Lachnospiraceae bacterium]|nr:DUF5050 domain-containing protein [Lachnospiraceae bacterium]MDE7238770.1 DUF5050 domain-containing protein [Lachnospiraceae bacterium]